MVAAGLSSSMMPSTNTRTSWLLPYALIMPFTCKGARMLASDRSSCAEAPLGVQAAGTGSAAHLERADHTNACHMDVTMPDLITRESQPAKDSLTEITQGALNVAHVR